MSLVRSTEARSIVRAEIWTVRVVVPPGVWHGKDFVGDERGDFSLIPKLILRLRSRNGVTGVGEGPREANLTALAGAVRSLLGRDATALRLDRFPFDPAVAEVIEVALLDLVGRLADLPSHRLLGGACRDRVPIAYCTGRRSTADLAEVALKALALGCSVVKVKCTRTDPLREKAEAVRQATGGKVRVRLDPNDRFDDVATTMHVAALLADEAIECFESPVPQDRLDWYGELRARLAIPIALHLEDPRLALAAVRGDAADAFNFGGSPTAFLTQARLAELAGRPVWHGSGVDFGIADAAAVHACAAAPGCTWPSDLVGNFLRPDDLIQSPLILQEGALVVPAGPGLGVELDEDAVEHYSVAPKVVID
jgi:muconate cycloisomerase